MCALQSIRLLDYTIRSTDSSKQLGGVDEKRKLFSNGL